MTSTSSPINSGAINKVAFPGSQQGQSLIELAGSIVVTATIATVSVLSTTGATAAPSANGTASQPKIKAYLTAAVAPSASASCGAQTRLKTVPDALVAPATVSTPAPKLYRRASATATPAATISALAYIETLRGATTTGVANSSVGTRRKINFSAYLNPGANTTLEALRRVKYSASASGQALFSVNGIMGRAVQATTSATGYGSTTERISKAHFLGASTAPSATTTAATRRNATTNAIITARAVTSVGSRQNSSALLDPLTLAPSTSAQIQIKALRGATISSSLISVAVGVNMDFNAGASATAQATVSCDSVVENFVNCAPQTAAAVVSSPNTGALTKYAGSASGQAVTSPILISMRVLRGASDNAVATTSASATRIFSLGAVATSAAQVPAINAEVENYVFPVLQPAAATCSTTGIELKIPFGIQIKPSAIGLAGLGLRLGVQATTTAQANAAAAGADYAITAPAPIERRMSVAYQNRVMEVLT